MYTLKSSTLTFIGVLLSASILLMAPQPAYAQGGTQNVRVVNTSSQAVPTTVQGTTTVTGNVNIDNTPTVTLSPSGNHVQAQQNGTWNVGITGIPTMNLASGSAVGITGTPNVSLTSGSSVTVANSATNPIPVQNVGGTPLQTTLLLNSGNVTIPNTTASTNLGDFDASTYSRIRVVTKSNCGSANGIAIRVVVLENGQPVQLIEEINPCSNFPAFKSTVSKIIDMPGTTLRITVFQEGALETQQIVQVVVYGR
jgi:hypothetical protein